ncbi:hypothetical protein H9Q73_014299 [Fusarium xylarioides]|nr:hypothetical protein H9Q73_014299 [Fusarium xylarioides]
MLPKPKAKPKKREMKLEKEAQLAKEAEDLRKAEEEATAVKEAQEKKDNAAKKRAKTARKKAEEAEKAKKEAEEAAKKDPEKDDSDSSGEDDFNSDEVNRIGRIDLGDRFKYLPEEIHGKGTGDFDWTVERPTTQPDLTIWVFYHALKKCSYKGIEAIYLDIQGEPTEPCELKLREFKKGTMDPYAMTFSSQNANAMLRHLYGILRSESEVCDKCKKENGALAKCHVYLSKLTGCTNSSKRKHDGSDDNSESEPDSAVEAATELLDSLDRATCQSLSKFFKRATDSMKGKKKKAKKSKN